MSAARVNAGLISIRVNGAEYTLDQVSGSWPSWNTLIARFNLEGESG